MIEWLALALGMIAVVAMALRWELKDQEASWDR